MTRAMPRGTFHTLFTGACVLVLVYFGRNFRGWSMEQRVTFSVAILVIAGGVLLGDWIARRDLPRRPPAR